MNDGRRKPARRNISGLLLLDKDPGLTSNAALQRIKRLFDAKKAGHCGSLDPCAVGMLPICFGNATKFADCLLLSGKTYLTTIQLGIETTTGDLTGEVTSRSDDIPSEQAVRDALKRFQGEITQIPPMYSAIKKDGKPLYELARQGIEVQREPRQVVIDYLNVLDVDGPMVRVELRCSKGTYVRSIAMDLGTALGCGGAMADLRRTSVGLWKDEDSITEAELAAMSEEDRARAVRPVSDMTSHLTSTVLSLPDYRMLEQQRRIVVRADEKPGIRAIYCGERFCGTGEITEEQVLKVVKLLPYSPQKG